MGVTKVSPFAEILWFALGVALIFHGAQFKNLFLCAQVVIAFCYLRVKEPALSLYKDVQTAMEKMNEEESDESKADAKAAPAPGNKHAEKRAAKKDDGKSPQQQREDDAAAAKKLLKVVDSKKVTDVVFEVCVAAMACHMVMEGGLARVVVVTYALVTACKEKIVAFLDFSEHEDMQAWTDLLLAFVLYCFFGGMAVIASSLALALLVAFCGAQLVTKHGLRLAASRGKIPEGQSAEAFAASLQGLAVLGGLTAFGTLWQFWALMADSGMAWYFKIIYLPAYSAECIVGLF